MDGGSPLWRFWGGNWGPEIAYISFKLNGLKAVMELPSDWHEHSRVWFRLSLGLVTIAWSFPWFGKLPPDEGQCSGPTYGFAFFAEYLWIYHGKATGRPKDGSRTTIKMPWGWKFREHKILSEWETHPYHYRLRNEEVQQRSAKVRKESRLWTRYWIPWRLYRETIDVEFDDEVGERTGSWKGGTIGCGYEMKSGETPLQTLRRMERERIFK